MLSATLRLRAEEHVRELAEQHRVRLRWTKEWNTSEVNIPSRQAFIPRRLRLGIEYLAALHELGHLVDRRSRTHRHRWEYAAGKDVDYEHLLDEAAAWAWALRAAKPSVLEGMTKTDWRRLGACWASHASGGAVW